MRVASVALAGWTSLASLGWIAVPSAAATGPASLVRDINTEFDPSRLLPPVQHLGDAPFARVGEVTYFFVGDDLHGRELWRSEGTDASTRLVIDLCPGDCSSRGLGLVAAGSSLYFWADDGASGTELWRSDGTAEGTRRAREFCAGPCHAPHALRKLHPVGEKVFFQVTSNGAKELWVSDGTEVGTRRVVTWPIEPVIPGEPDKIQGSLGGWVLFEFPTTAAGTELWRSDGTEEGTGLLADLCPGPTSSLAFVVGTTETRALVQTTGCTSFIAHSLVDNFGQITEFGNPSTFRMQFGVRWNANSLLVVAGPELVLLDLIARSGVVLANVAPPVLGGQAIGVPVVSGGRALFPALSDGFGVEPWITDGSIGGTRRLVDLVPGDGSSMRQLEPPTAAGSGDGFYFEATAGAGREPWFTDGTAGGTRSLGDIVPGLGGSVPRFGGGSPSMMIAAVELIGDSVFVTDGTATGTRRTTSPRYRLASSFPHDLTALANRVAFAAMTIDYGVEPWHSDGTAAGTRLIADTLPGPLQAAFGVIGNFTRFGARWVFTSNGLPFVMDRAGTRVTPIPGAERAVEFVALNGRLFFSAAIPGVPGREYHAPEPFVLEPLQGRPSASMLVDIFPGAYCVFLFCVENGSYPSDPAVAGGGSLVYFAAGDGVAGREPWLSDGTAAGTRRVSDLCPGDVEGLPRSSAPRDLIGFNDGTAVAVVAGDCAPRLVRLLPDSPPEVLLENVGEPRELTVLGLRVYFFVQRAGGDELWWQSLADGSHGRVRRLWLGGRPGFAQELTVAGSRLFFRVSTESTGAELWTSDGSAVGTRLLEIVPGRRGAGPRNLTSIDGQLVFSASDGTTGAEFWVSDGTRAGTRLIQDIATGGDASSPAEFTQLGDGVYFAAGDATHGRELWSIPRSALRPSR